VGAARAVGLLLGVVADAIIGDPQNYHPVAGFGRLAVWAERVCYTERKLAGVIYTGSLVGAAAAVGNLLERAVHGRAAGQTAATALAVWVALGAATLADEGAAMAQALDAGDLETARAQLPHLCGRDPASLDLAGVARASLESIAENTSDAVVAPLIWGALAGVPGLLAYRAVNTLDAMVGYRSARYLRFGWAAARMDDVANWVPARVTAALTAACAPLVTGASPVSVLNVVRRDGGRHPSPNAGRCEAAFAAALGVRLGGTNVYGGVTETRPDLGEGRAPEPTDIRRAILLSRAVTVAATALAVLIAVLSAGGRS
jgi:adenosylcobinamide-phosphate synthase